MVAFIFDTSTEGAGSCSLLSIYIIQVAVQTQHIHIHSLNFQVNSVLLTQDQLA